VHLNWTRIVVLHLTNSFFLTGFTGFQPKKRGTYVVDIVRDGAKFPGSPFQIQVGDGEQCTAAKVKVSGAVREGMSNKWNEVLINVADAGKSVCAAGKFV
jgi:hypothetical protein